MISVEEATQTILSHFHSLDAEEVPLLDACARVLAHEVRSPEAIPPFDNSAMDGYAVRLADTASASAENPIPLKVVADIPAGRAPSARVEPGTAIRIMTGAVIPEGCDAVVMREDTREHGDSVEILCAPEPAEFIRRSGSDVAQGSLVFEAGTVLNPAALGVLASIGLGSVSVVRRPRVALLATGDELVELDAPLGPGQIRASSSYALEALLRTMGCEVVQLGIARDEREELKEKIALGVRADLLLTTGGVSVGDYDLVKEVLGELGAMNFWQVNMQPGKPLAFGLIEGTPVLGLPGNPVSSLVVFEVFVRPALRALQGHGALQAPRVKVRLSSAFDKKGSRRQFLRARLHEELGELYADLMPGQGSHQLATLARANALLILAEGTRFYEAGESVEALWLEGYRA